jgi:hypothetical protein
VLGAGFHVPDVALQVGPELGLGDWDLSDLLALREDGQALALMIEVLELDVGAAACSGPTVAA